MKLFYTIDDYPKMKILEDNYEIIKNEIPEFIFENIIKCMTNLHKLTSINTYEFFYYTIS